MKPRASRVRGHSETLVVENWAREPTKIVVRSDAVLIELPDDFSTLFKEGINSLELLGEGEEYFLKTQEGTVPPVSLAFRVLGRNLLITIEQGSVPINLSIWILMKSCSCHLVFSPTGVGYRKYILQRT
jgi:hypothetical protein